MQFFLGMSACCRYHNRHSASRVVMYSVRYSRAACALCVKLVDSEQYMLFVLSSKFALPCEVLALPESTIRADRVLSVMPTSSQSISPDSL